MKNNTWIISLIKIRTDYNIERFQGVFHDANDGNHRKIMYAKIENNKIIKVDEIYWSKNW
jgi:hypothetical protein